MVAELTLWMYIGITAAFLVAWINGANNAGNAIGTVVGARVLNARKALIMAAVFDLAGALVFGEFVSATLMRGIVDPSRIERLDLLIGGMCAALIGTFTWVFISTLIKVPMSISQAIVGGVMGFGLVAAGVEAILWRKVLEVVASWVYLPFMSIAISVGLYKLYKHLAKGLTRSRLILISAVFMYLTVFTTVFLLMVKTAKMEDLVYAAKISTGLSMLASIAYVAYAVRRIPAIDLNHAEREVFKHLLITSCMAMAFSHGANDVANAAGPLAAILYTVENGHPPGPGTPVTPFALVLSAIGLSTGILVWGYRILETIGEKIVPLTPETGFIAQFSGALTTLIVTRLGLPVSTTVAIVGAVAGVGIARGTEYLNIRTLLKIVAMWFIGFPFVALLSALMVLGYMHMVS
ncbi:MAG: inorganic phosphate transporter [Desulfurococcaceae archaeon]